MTKQVEDLLAALTSWAAARPDVQAVALVGSRARDEARADSDVDVVVLSDQPAAYLGDEAWTRGLRVTSVSAPQGWGAVTSRRAQIGSGLEVEFGFASPAWANTDPVDEGTRRVVLNGFRVIYDRTGILSRLVRTFTRD